MGRGGALRRAGRVAGAGSGPCGRRRAEQGGGRGAGVQMGAKGAVALQTVCMNAAAAI